MASSFTRMLSGEMPARFVWQDELCAAIVSKTPIKPGHCILFPREEVTNWLDLPPALASHLIGVAQKIGRGIQDCFRPVRVGMAIVSIQNPHVHIHLVPINTVPDLDFSKQEQNPDPAELERAAERLRATLKDGNAQNL